MRTCIEPLDWRLPDKEREAAGMVIVAVAEHDGPDRTKVDPHQRRVVQKRRVRTAVEKQGSFLTVDETG